MNYNKGESSGDDTTTLQRGVLVVRLIAAATDSLFQISCRKALRALMG